MEQSLVCNVGKCGAQLSGQALVTACSHALCIDCASRHGITEQGPSTCPVCRQPLADAETSRQLLRPSEEYKSVVLAGLSPTIVMECAGRALSFWAYQMTNQILRQSQMNRNLQLHCASLEREVESIWNQGNTRIGGLTAKMKDMELEEQGLRRKCEELRAALAEKNKKFEQTQELYNKLKHRVLLEQRPDSPPDMLGPRGSTVVDAGGGGGPFTSRLTRPPSLYRTDDQSPPRGSMHGGEKVPERSNYFPTTSSRHSRTQGGGSVAAPMGWGKSTSQRVPGTPMSQIPIANPAASGFTSSRRDIAVGGGDSSLPIPGSSRFTHPRASQHQQPLHSERMRSYSGTTLNSDTRASRAPMIDPRAAGPPLSRAGSRYL